MLTHDEIFCPPLDSGATLKTLVTSNRLPIPLVGLENLGALHYKPVIFYYAKFYLERNSNSGWSRPWHSLLTRSLPLTVEIYRAAPYLPPSHIGRLGASPHLTSPEEELFAQSDSTTQHVYMAVHTSTG